MILSVVCVVYCIVLGVGVHSVAIPPPPLFYPYGTSNGDTVAPVNDDGSTSAISMSSFPFYASTYTSLFVNTNGAISFDYAFSSFTPAPFPLATKMVAPFWSDVDTTRNNGRVYYRVYRDCYGANVRCAAFPPDHYTLDQISQDVKTNCMSSFVGRYMVIATWQNVTYYGGNAATPTNTFQCALISDGSASFAIFNYGPITWTTGTASGGSPSTGLGGTPAQVGFNADSSHYYSLPDSRTANIVNIASTTNVQRAGRYIFRVDQSIIALNSCKQNDSILILRNDFAGSTSRFFNRSWTQYQQGFGNPTTLYWIGLDRLHQLTQGNCRARFDLQDRNGTWYYAQYTTFSVGSSSTNYTLTTGGYSGNAGYDAMLWCTGQQFSTYDSYSNRGLNTCASWHGGGFWYGDCTSVGITTSAPGFNFWWRNSYTGFMNLNAVQVSLLC